MRVLLAPERVALQILLSPTTPTTTVIIITLRPLNLTRKNIEIAVLGADGAVAGIDLLGVERGDQDLEGSAAAVAGYWVPGFWLGGGGGGVRHGWGTW